MIRVPPAQEYPVLEVGGTHVAAALVALGQPPEILSAVRLPIDAQASENQLLATFAEAGRRLDAPPGCRWGVALPGPFDYARGIGRYKNVEKLYSLDGVDVGRALRERLEAKELAFINDANAFLVGEHALGTGKGEARIMALTLGTGVGSAFLDHGRIIETGPHVPPEGRVDLLRHEGAPLEDSFSQRAIRAAYERELRPDGGLVDARPDVPDVSDIAALARGADTVARAVLRRASQALGTCVAPWVERFGATSVVMGGSMTRSWDVFRPGFVAGLIGFSPPLSTVRVIPARRLDDAPLIGAACHADQAGASSGKPAGGDATSAGRSEPGLTTDRLGNG
jgi:glucokinase